MIARLHFLDSDKPECSFETHLESGRISLTIGDIELYASPAFMRSMARSITDACNRLEQRKASVQAVAA